MINKITRDDVDDLAVGSAFLGTGGGGDPQIGSLMLKRILGEGKHVELIDVNDCADDALILPSGMFGAPTAIVEMLPSGFEGELALLEMERLTGRNVTAMLAAEVGGMNSLIPFIAAASRGLPVVDGDGMGRAFPQLHMVTFNVFGNSASPVVMADHRGDTVIIRAAENADAERIARQVVMGMGCSAHVCCYPLTGANARRCVVRGTLSIALQIGRAIHRRTEFSGNVIDAILQVLENTGLYGRAEVIFGGKVVDVCRNTREGFASGTVKLAGLDSYEGEMAIDFQNENLVARHDGEVRVIVPDLICIVNHETGYPITTESLNYGQRVVVVGVSAPAIMRSPESLRIFGPQAFGLSEPYIPFEELTARSRRDPPSVTASTHSALSNTHFKRQS